MSRKLLLFDIDGTLLDSGGAGARALHQTASQIFEVPTERLPSLDLAGATDGSVLHHYAQHLNLDPAMPWMERFKVSYFDHLKEHLHSPQFEPRLLEGVQDLIHWLNVSTPHVLGLLTGNWRKGAYLKLQRFALHDYFIDGGFGDDGIHRNELGPHAVDRLKSHSAYDFAKHEIFVIGDTPKDIACANAIGVRCIAVATGAFSEAQLAEHSPWQVLPNLSDRKRFEQLLAM